MAKNLTKDQFLTLPCERLKQGTVAVIDLETGVNTCDGGCKYESIDKAYNCRKASIAMRQDCVYSNLIKYIRMKTK